MPKTPDPRLGGLAKVARHGRAAMADMSAKGQAGLNARIARDAGIPDDAPDRDVRLDAARRAYFIRLRAKGANPKVRAVKGRTA